LPLVTSIDSIEFDGFILPLLENNKQFGRDMLTSARVLFIKLVFFWTYKIRISKQPVRTIDQCLFTMGPPRSTIHAPNHSNSNLFTHFQWQIWLG
jgi:hypothetical protein